MINNKIDKRLFERIIQKYDKATILNEITNETVETTKYIGGKMFIKEIDFNELPLSSRVSVSSDYWNELKDIYGSSPSITFEKVGRDVWKCVEVFKPGPIGKPNSYISVNNGIEVSISDILIHNFFKSGDKKYIYDDITISVPLYKKNGDMNVLYMYNGGQEFRYDSRFSLLKLLRAVENDDAYIKFSTTRQDGTIVINICYGRDTYFLRCYESEFMNFCDEHDIYIHKSNFNTYF
jgi:hypothetical protein